MKLGLCATAVFQNPVLSRSKRTRFLGTPSSHHAHTPLYSIVLILLTLLRDIATTFFLSLQSKDKANVSTPSTVSSVPKNELFDASSKREALNSVGVSSGVSNTTAATQICSGLSGTTNGDPVSIFAQNTAEYYLLPSSCPVYYTGWITTLTAKNMVIRGNSTFPDPLVWLGKTFVGVRRIDLSFGAFEYADGSSYVVDWSSVLSAFPSIASFQLTNMRLAGSLPSSLSFPSSLSRFNIGFNQLSGTIPPSLFASLIDNDGLMVFIASGNPGINGPLPDPFLGNVSMDNMGSLEIAFDGTSLSGGLPENLFAPSMRLLNDFILALNSISSLTGSVPSNFFANIITKEYTASNPSINIQCNGCGLTGALVLPEAASSFASTPVFTLTFPKQFSGITFGTNSAYYIQKLDLTGPSSLAGEIENLFASDSSRLTSFFATRTSLAGTMPLLAGTAVGNSLTSLGLDSTSIQFCMPVDRPAWTGPASCSLQYTTAYYCQSNYAGCSAGLPPPPAPAPVPVFAPVVIAPTFVPISAPYLPPAEEAPTTPPPENPPPVTPPAGPSCPPETKPKTGNFECVGNPGQWTSTTSVDVPTLIIPASSVSTTTVVIGNVSSSTIEFGGLGNTLEVQGCATNLTTITVTLDSNDLNRIGNAKLRQLLMSLNGSGPGCSNLMDVTVNSVITGSTCKKVTTESKTEGTQLIALFSISSAGCKSKTWWIVLVSVLCGLVVILVVVLILVFTLNQKARVWIRPYSKKRPKGAPSL